MFSLVKENGSKKINDIGETENPVELLKDEKEEERKEDEEKEERDKKHKY